MKNNLSQCSVTGIHLPTLCLKAYEYSVILNHNSVFLFLHNFSNFLLYYFVGYVHIMFSMSCIYQKQNLNVDISGGL
jgi:hypothetical protein